VSAERQAAFAYITGWRRSEVMGLTWAQVDFTARLVRLEPGTTKNGTGRMFPFTPDLASLLERQRALTTSASTKLGRIIHDADLHAAAVKLAALSAAPMGTITGTVARIGAREGREALAK
jgi:integrase